ncbi:MAG: hypothetical protein M1835_004317 [Candelina submexicana]|nr:MAG: hypothetical protein M1835_004317 [Candelina submexicana]
MYTLLFKQELFFTIVPGFILFFVSLYIVRILSWRYLHLRDVPGPTGAAFGRFWLVRALASGSSAVKYLEVNKQYGPLARIGPNHLITSDPQTARRLLAVHSKYTRGPWYDCLRIDPERSTLVTERDTRKHNVLRHQMAPGYGGKGIADLELNVDARLREWISIIDRDWASRPGETKRFDIGRSIQYLTMDVISHLSFGEPLGFVKNQKDMHDFLKILESRLPVVEQFSVLTEFTSVLTRVSQIAFLKKWIIPSAKDKTGLGRILGISKNVVDRRVKEGIATKNDMLGSFLQHGVDKDQVESEITVSLFAGSDTTATAIRATLLHIITNPSVHSRLQSEIDLAWRRGRISDIVQTKEAVHELLYLQACIKEGLRIFPPITALRERVTPPQGDIINGHHIPGGVNVGLNMRGVLLNEVFGSDPEVFRPERWLESAPEDLQQMEKVQDLVFGHGFTRCLGISIAAMNLNKALVEVCIYDPKIKKVQSADRV